MKITVGVALAILWMAINGVADVQMRDKLIYQGKEFPVIEWFLMQTYFQKYPDKNPVKGIGPSFLYRGCLATFEFQDNNLVLKDIETARIDSTIEHSGIIWKSIKNQFLPEGEILKIDWFSGVLILPYGDILNPHDPGAKFFDDFKYSNYILIAVKNGKFAGERKFDYKELDQFAEKQYQAFKKTEAFKEKLLELRKDLTDKNLSPDYINEKGLWIFNTEFSDEESSKKFLEPIEPGHP
jgi:hypothetical protein